MTRLSRPDKAREHFMEALALDVKCFDAFEELIKSHLLDVDQGVFGFDRANDDTQLSFLRGKSGSSYKAFNSCSRCLRMRILSG